MRASGNFTAAMLAMASTALLSFIDNFIVVVLETHGLWQFHLVRSLIAMPLIAFMALMFKQRIRPVNLKLLSARSAFVSMGLLVYFLSLATMPVAQAGAGLFSAPIWVLVMSAILFRHRIAFPQVAVVLAGFAGVIMVLQPNMHGMSIWSLLPLLSGAFYGLGMMLTRYWCSGESVVSLVLGVFSALGIAGFAFMMAAELSLIPGSWHLMSRGWIPVSGTFLWLTLLQALVSIAAVSLIAQAYRIGTPSFVAVFEYSFLVFASLWTFLLWGRGMDLLSVFGIAVIIATGVAMMVFDGDARDRH
ncbi:MAG: DMT family transporter [Roseovarius sp.]|nr:DMT family transporter [Roseovarius sp.]